MTSAASAPSRSRRVTGLIVGVLLGLLSLGIAFGIYIEFVTLRDPAGNLVRSCVSSGARCDQNLLNTICYIGYALCLFGWGVPTAFMLVRFIRQRRAWFFPLISIGVVVVGFYILLAVLGRSYGI